MKRFLLLSLFLVSALLARAAAPVDLAPDLGYLRVTGLDHGLADIGAALAVDRALVLDLRYPQMGGATAAQVYQALARRQSHAPLFVLVSPATPALLAEALAAAPVKFVTLGVADSVPAPQVVVTQTAAADRAAYDALAAGADLAALVSGKVVKERYDEAALMSDFRNGNTDAQPPPPPDPTKEKTGTAAPANPAPPVDRVLQRALHLHRALLAVQPRS
jgi:hypothetical protein